MLEALAQIVRTAAREELLPLFAEAERRYKPDGSIVTDADFAMQRRMTDELANLAPQYRLLGEEMTGDEQSKLLDSSEGGLWCLDPLDGTSNFASGVPFFSVSLGLLIERKPYLGLVYDPIRDECFTAIKGQGSRLNGKPLPCGPVGLPLRKVIAVVDFKRLSPQLAGALVSRPPYSSQRNFGSVALEWSWLAARRFQVYLHGRQMLWDYAAGALILSEAGGCVENLHGEPIFSPQLQPSSAVAACDPILFTDWKNWLDSHKSP
ncbi:MAG: inositol monophosphatase [Candidatus Methylumidiphilus sp.]